MERGELAEIYLTEYEDTDVTITYVDEIESENFDYYGVVLFGTSDGRHWFADNNDHCEVKFRAETVDWDDNNGYGGYTVNGKPADEQDYWI